MKKQNLKLNEFKGNEKVQLSKVEMKDVKGGFIIVDDIIGN